MPPAYAHPRVTRRPPGSRVTIRTVSAPRTAPWRVLVVHGAGSTGATAQALLQPLWQEALPDPWTVTAVEDRTGDVEEVAEHVAVWLRGTAGAHSRRIVAGISLGAHAAILGAMRAGDSEPPSCIVAAMPAWLGPADGTARLTQRAGSEIAEKGISQTIERIRREAPIDREWVIRALEEDWSRYTDDSLSASLATAARGRAPEPSELRQLDFPVLLLGIDDDPLHPRAVSESWLRHLDQGRLATIDPHTHRGFASPAAITALASIVSENPNR